MITLLKNASLFFLSLLLITCGGDTDPSYQPQFGDSSTLKKEEYIFGVHPLHNPQQLQAVYGPLIDFLNTRIKEISFRLEASRNYATYEEKLYAGKFQFALPNPYQTILAEDRNYQIFGKMGDDENFKGIILTRKDSPIQKISDLKSQAISYPAPTALAATLLPQYFLHSQGLDINRDLQNHYVGSQESSIMNVYLKKVAAGATWPLPWKTFQKDHPDFAKELQIKWETSTLPNNGLVVHTTVPTPILTQVSQLLFELHTHSQGQEILARMPLSKFEKADHQTYQVVRDFIHNFTQNIRVLEVE